QDKKKKKKPKKLRRAVGLVVTDPKTQRILMLSSRKREGKFVLPRADCGEDEPFEQTAQRILLHEACVQTLTPAHRIGVFVEANKKGKTIAHHCMYQVDCHKELLPPPDDHRQRVWVTFEEAQHYTEDRNMSHVAL
ncbi:hypothetical protein DM01DRAFT_1270414, partial [Hesseltinella vesiculosa]